MSLVRPLSHPDSLRAKESFQRRHGTYARYLQIYTNTTVVKPRICAVEGSGPENTLASVL